MFQAFIAKKKGYSKFGVKCLKVRL